MDLIDEIIQREGGSKATDIQGDRGGRTQYGISERSHPEVWKKGFVTYDEAREIYHQKYLAPFDLLRSHLLFEQAVDFGVTSGPRLAIQKIQELVEAEVDGILGPDTVSKVSRFEPRMINNLLMGSRVKMIGRLVQKNPSQLKFLSGWLNRCLSFLR